MRLSSRSRFIRLCNTFIAGSLLVFATQVGWLAGEQTQPALSPAAASTLTPDRLHCEYRVNPLGIDSAHPRLDWILQSGDTAARNLAQSSYQILVASSPELLNDNQGDLWDSGKVMSDQMNQIAYAGKPLLSNQAVWWKVKVWDQNGTASVWSLVAKWTMGTLNATDWSGAKWIGAPDANESFDPRGANGPKAKYETVLLRHEFTVKPGLKRALVHICGLGLYEMTLNGDKVGDAVLTPGWTTYAKTCLYDTYDITSSLKEGANAVGVFLGNGFYNNHKGRYTWATNSSGWPQAIGLIRLEYQNGNVDTIVTDEHWKTASGPITYSTAAGGEDYDARLVQDGWDKPNFADATWDTPAITFGPGGVLKGLSCAAPPIRVQQVLAPISSQQFGPNETVYNLGQNAALMLALKVKGLAGSSVKVIPSELINGNGTINDPMNHGDAYWTYTLSGKGEEGYISKFYYRGARYLKVELKPAQGTGDLPQIESIEGRIIRADAPAAGQFSCSNEMYAKLFGIIRWAQMNNMMSVMTDCPTREKLGYLEELYLNGPALRYNFDFSVLATKATHDMADAQSSNGKIPLRAPFFGDSSGEGGFTTSIEWGSACIVVPWQQYEFDGDVTLLRERYDSMKHYLDYLDHKTKNHIINFGLGDWYDNHSEGKPSLTPVYLTGTAFYYQDLRIMEQIARLLGRDDDAAQFNTQAVQVLTAFNQSFFDPATNNYATGSQGANCLSLAMDLVDPANRRAVFDHLVQDLRAKGTTAGEVSFHYLLRALADAGRSDLIYSTYMNDTQGYGLQVKLGKTSLTEGWNGGASQDHFMYGQINEWFYHDLAGIQADPADFGFKKIIIKPAIVGDLTWVKASYVSMAGKIVSEWKRDGQAVWLHVVIPPNTTASIDIPAANVGSVSEGGKPAAQAPGVKFLKMDTEDPPTADFQVGSGDYTFRFTRPSAP